MALVKNLARLLLSVEHFLPLNARFVLTGRADFTYMATEDPYKATAFQAGGIADNVMNQCSLQS